jgi:hypothetical protein
MIKTKMDLMRIRHTRLITDPFPEHTEYESIKSQLGAFFGLWKKEIRKPEEISIHKAYHMGYEQAYKEIEAALKE